MIFNTNHKPNPLQYEEFKTMMKEGEKGLVILDETPFYAEKGGQVGDIGTLSHKKARFEVVDCKAPNPGVIAHVGVLKSGALIVGEPITAKVEVN